MSAGGWRTKGLPFFRAWSSPDRLLSVLSVLWSNKETGISPDKASIERATAEVIAFMAAAGWRHLISIPSPIYGGDGNRETVAAFARGRLP